jgi:AraC-like DNA-binding protein
MVCTRCKIVVKSELENLGLKYKFVELGEVELVNDITPIQKENLNMALKRSGLELIDDKKSKLIEKIKILIVDLVHYSDEPLGKKLSDYLSEKLNYDYTYLANLFSEVQGTTIEKLFITHKIERVKELLIYDELNLKEIAYKLHYSSVAHLSTQFKKHTGLTPSLFKHLGLKRHVVLEKVLMM